MISHCPLCGQKLNFWGPKKARRLAHQCVVFEHEISELQIIMSVWNQIRPMMRKRFVKLLKIKGVKTEMVEGAGEK